MTVFQYNVLKNHEQLEFLENRLKNLNIELDKNISVQNQLKEKT